MSPSEAPTEALDRKHVAVRVGNHRFTLPVATVLVAILGALGTAYRVVEADREAMQGRVLALEQRCMGLTSKLETESLMMAEIRAQLSRIDARVAEIQVTLMRDRR